MRKLTAILLLLFWPSCLMHGQMLQAIVNSKTAGSSSPAPSVVQPTIANPIVSTCGNFGSSVTCAFPVNVTAGNGAYILLTALSGTGTFTTPSCTSGTAIIGTFTAVGAGFNNTSQQGQWYHASITGSGSCTISAPFSGSTYIAIFPWEVSNDLGPDTGTNPVYADEGFCGGTACPTVSITTVTNNDVVLYAQSQGNAQTFSALTTYSLIAQFSSNSTNPTFLIASTTKATAGAVTATFNMTSGNSYLDSAIAIK